VLFATESGGRLFPADVWSLVRRLGKASPDRSPGYTLAGYLAETG
jgi:hypothetical protein